LIGSKAVLQRRDRIAALVRELAAKRFTYCENSA
jgi:hypothetical protein